MTAPITVRTFLLIAFIGTALPTKASPATDDQEVESFQASFVNLFKTSLFQNKIHKVKSLRGAGKGQPGAADPVQTEGSKPAPCAGTEVSVPLMPDVPALPPKNASTLETGHADKTLKLFGMADAEEHTDYEGTSCTEGGLTPGVCVIASLARVPAPTGSEMNFLDPQLLEKALFAELNAALSGTHSGFSKGHLAKVEQELSAMFATLHKNDIGGIGHSEARYAVHQRFLRGKHWYISSMNPAGDGQVPASPGEALRAQVPTHLLNLIGKLVGKQGLKLNELAVLVATIEHLIEGDMGERMKASYAAYDYPSNATLNSDQAISVLQTFLAHYMSLEHRSGYALTPGEAVQELKTIKSGYSNWNKIVGHMNDQVFASPVEVPFSFQDMMRMGKEVTNKFEDQSASECVDFKQELLGFPGASTGGVLLADMHKAALEGHMEFAESTEYLRTVGALDESNPESTRVLIPNLLYGPSNCMGTTSFFDSCCPNECNKILARFENELHVPDATPAEIAQAYWSTSYGSLPANLLEHLEELAKKAEGRVPLQGRGFAEWLHQAYPLECPKPQAEHYSSDLEVPDARKEFQAAASVMKSVQASRQELKEEVVR